LAAAQLGAVGLGRMGALEELRCGHPTSVADGSSAEPGSADTRINALWYWGNPDSHDRCMTAQANELNGAERLGARAWGMLLVLCGAIFLDAMDVSMVGVALPSIREDLGMSTSSLQWVVSAYVLGYGGFLLLGGRAADLLGRRRVFLIALGVFVVAS